MKKYIVVVALVAFLGSIGYCGLKNFYSSESLTELQLRNIEALTDSEQDPCDNYNGYRRILEGNEKIYDCCYKEQIGRGKEIVKGGKV